MDAGLRSEATGHRVPRLSRQTFEVRDVHVHGVDCFLARGFGGEQYSGARVQRDSPVTAVVVPAGEATQGSQQVLGTPHEPHDVRFGGDGGGS